MKKISTLFFTLFINFSIAQTPILLNPNIGSPHQISDFFGVNGANVLEQGQGFDSPDLPQALKLLHPATIRYPGGTVANWWDWDKGGFVTQEKLKESQCYGLPFNLGSIQYPNNNTLGAFSNSIYSTGAKPVFVLNLISSTLSDQMAMLSEAQLQGLPMVHVELGNEFYLENCNYIEKFPTTTDYVNTCIDYIQEIRKRFQNVKISVAGAIGGVTPRRSGWNDLITQPNFPAHSTPDAYTLHLYPTPTLSQNGVCSFNDYFSRPSCSSSTIGDVLFVNAIDKIENQKLAGSECKKLSQSGEEIWFTEFNLDDTHDLIHGSWAHALYTATLALKMLELNDENVTHVDCHTMLGDYVFSSLFGNDHAFDGSLTPGDNGHCSVTPPGLSVSTGQTIPFTKSALGIVYSEISEAAQGADHIASIDFGSNVPLIKKCNSSTSWPAVLGYQFQKANGNEEVVLNLSNSSVTFDAYTFLGSNQDYTTSNYDLNDFVQGQIGNQIYYSNLSASLNYSGPYSKTQTTGSISASSPPVVLAPYSITKFRSSNALDFLLPVAGTLCENSDILLKVITSGNSGTFQLEIRNNGGTTILTQAGSATNDVFKVRLPAGSYSASISTNPTRIVSFTVNGAPVVTASTLQNVICKGDVVQLTSSGSGGQSNNYQYVWFPNENIVSGSAMTSGISASPQTDISYKVYISDGRCSAVSNKIDIKVVNANVTATYPSVICNTTPSGSVTLSLPSVSISGVTASYQWNGVSGQTLQVPNGASEYSGIATYFISSPSHSCTYTTPVIHLASCCASGSNINFNNDVNTHQFSDRISALCSTCAVTNVPAGGLPEETTIDAQNWSPQTFELNGKLLVDQDLVLKNFKIVCSEGAEIDVAPYHKLTLDGCQFNDCSGQMWEGIHVMEHGKLEVFKSQDAIYNSRIVGARHAIHLFNSSDLTVRGTLFNRNYVGIYYEPNPNFNITTVALNNCEFKATNIPTKYSWMQEITNSNGLCGIYVNDGMLSIGSAGSSYSHFDGLNAGIIAMGSVVGVTNSMFENIQPSYNGQYSGCAIYSAGLPDSRKYSYLNADGLDRTQVRINNCKVGIRTYLSSAVVRNFGIENVETGIDIIDARTGTVEIDQNSIISQKDGVRLLLNDRASKVFVTHNIITRGMGSNYGKQDFSGITIGDEGLVAAGRIFNVTCNDLFTTMNSSGNGLCLNATANVSASQNYTALSNSDYPLRGINVQGSSGCSLSFNAVTGQSTDLIRNRNCIGLNLYNSGNTDILANGFSNTWDGARVLGSCLFSNFIDNSYGPANFGLHYTKTAQVGLQPVNLSGLLNGNKWTEYAKSEPMYTSTFGAKSDATSVTQDINNRYYVTGLEGTVYHPYVSEINSGSWFSPGTNSNIQLGTPISCILEERVKEPKFINYIDSMIVKNELVSSEFQKELTRISEEELLKKLSEDSLLLSQNEYFFHYFDSLKETSVGEIAILRSKLQDLINENERTNSVSAIDSETNAHLISLIDLLIQQQNESVGSEPLSFDSLMFNNLVEIRNNSMAATYIFNDWAKHSSGVWEELQTKNSEIAIANDMCFNQRFINAYSINRYISENLVNEQESTDQLIGIAHQCPLAGGNSVFAARTVLASLGIDENYSDDEVCTELGYMRYGQSPYFTINLLPNPAQDYVTISFEEKLDAQVAINIFDICGRLIQAKIINEGQDRAMLSVSDLTSGVYEIKCNGKDIGIITKKLIISR